MTVSGECWSLRPGRKGEPPQDSRTNYLKEGAQQGAYSWGTGDASMNKSRGMESHSQQGTTQPSRSSGQKGQDKVGMATHTQVHL